MRSSISFFSEERIWGNHLRKRKDELCHVLQNHKDNLPTASHSLSLVIPFVMAQFLQAELFAFLCQWFAHQLLQWPNSVPGQEPSIVGSLLPKSSWLVVCSSGVLQLCSKIQISQLSFLTKIVKHIHQNRYFPYTPLGLHLQEVELKIRAWQHLASCAPLSSVLYASGAFGGLSALPDIFKNTTDVFVGPSLADMLENYNRTGYGALVILTAACCITPYLGVVTTGQ